MTKKIVLLISFFTGVCWLAIAQEDTLEQSMKRGAVVYEDHCATCHMPQGEGDEVVCPPVANTNYLNDQQRAIDIILHGQDSQITVNEKQYNSPMDSMNYLTDKQVADVLNYISNSWGNKNPMIKPAQVKARRF